MSGTAELKKTAGLKDISVVDLDLKLYEKTQKHAKENAVSMNTLNRQILEKGYKHFLKKGNIDLF